jgi:hypothetical protein
VPARRKSEWEASEKYDWESPEEKVIVQSMEKMSTLKTMIEPRELRTASLSQNSQQEVRKKKGSPCTEREYLDAGRE